PVVGSEISAPSDAQDFPDTISPADFEASPHTATASGAFTRGVAQGALLGTGGSAGSGWFSRRQQETDKAQHPLARALGMLFPAVASLLVWWCLRHRARVARWMQP